MEWRLIHTKGYYVSDSGQIKSPRGKILKGTKDPKGYLRIDIPGSTVKVHRMVAKHFIPNPFNLPQVNHKNTIKTDNRVDNLEWVTGLQNAQHAKEMGLYAKRVIYGAANGCALLNEQQVLEIRRSFKPRQITRAILAKRFNVSEAAIKDVITRRSWKHLA